MGPMWVQIARGYVAWRPAQPSRRARGPSRRAPTPETGWACLPSIAGSLTNTPNVSWTASRPIRPMGPSTPRCRIPTAWNTIGAPCAVAAAAAASARADARGRPLHNPNSPARAPARGNARAPMRPRQQAAASCPVGCRRRRRPHPPPLTAPRRAPFLPSSAQSVPRYERDHSSVRAARGPSASGDARGDVRRHLQVH